jgi:hypothetical protein
MKIVKEPCGSIQKVPSGYFGEHFSKKPTTYLLGNNQANCFRAHKELTMDPLGKFPLAPSEMELVAKLQVGEQRIELAACQHLRRDNDQSILPT